MSQIPFKTLLDKHKGRSFLLYCPGKNVLDYHAQIEELIIQKNLMVIGLNKVSEIIDLDYHVFVNNDKYKAYGGLVKKQSSLILGSHIRCENLKRHNPERYVWAKYTDRDKQEKMSYDPKRDIIHGYYRTGGNLIIMLCHLMGAETVYVAGMCGFTYKFDGEVHYYKAEISRDRKTKKEWTNKYDKPVYRALRNMKKFGVNFKIITPTIYKDYYVGLGKL